MGSLLEGAIHHMVAARRNPIPRDALFKLYIEDGLSLRSIAAQYGYACGESVKQQLIEHGLPVRNRAGLLSEPYTVQSDFFSKWSQKMAYVTGLAAADATIRIRKESVAFVLKLKDLDLLRQVREAMGFTGPIHSRREGRIHVLAIYDRQIVTDLISLGISPRKSKSLQFPNVPDEFLRAFTLGYFDGDGCVAVIRSTPLKKHPPVLRVSFAGTQWFLSSLAARLSEQAGVRSKQPYKNVSADVYYLDYGRADGLKLYRWWYQADPAIYLRRKRKVFEDYINATQARARPCQDCGTMMPWTDPRRKRCDDCNRTAQRRANRRSRLKRKGVMDGGEQAGE